MTLWKTPGCNTVGLVGGEGVCDVEAIAAVGDESTIFFCSGSRSILAESCLAGRSPAAARWASVGRLSMVRYPERWPGGRGPPMYADGAGLSANTRNSDSLSIPVTSRKWSI